MHDEKMDKKGSYYRRPAPYLNKPPQPELFLGCYMKFTGF